MHFTALHHFLLQPRCGRAGVGGGTLQIPPGSCWQCATMQFAFGVLHSGIRSAAPKCGLVGTGGGRLRILLGSCWRCAMT